MATIRKRGDGWYAQVRRKGFPAEYKTFATKADAATWARDRESRIDRGEANLGARLATLTLGDLVRRYKEDVAPRLRGSGPEIARLGKMLRAPLCRLTLDALSASAIAAYRDDRLGEVAPSTVKLELSLFSRIIVLARREWDVPLPDNPIRKVCAPSFNNARDRRLRDGDEERLRKALSKTRNPLIAPILGFAIETAMRRGEILGLDWRDVDLKRRTVRLSVTKNGHARTVPLNDKAICILEARPSRNGPVFPITAVALRLAWNRLRKRAGLDDLRIHDLRHEATSRYAEMGLTAAELALISGHRDPRMLARYTHLRPTDLAKKLAGRSWELEVGA